MININAQQILFKMHEMIAIIMYLTYNRNVPLYRKSF